jgi:hypothetical protein
LPGRGFEAQCNADMDSEQIVARVRFFECGPRAAAGRTSDRRRTTGPRTILRGAPGASFSDEVRESWSVVGATAPRRRTSVVFGCEWRRRAPAPKGTPTLAPPTVSACWGGDSSGIGRRTSAVGAAGGSISRGSIIGLDPDRIAGRGRRWARTEAPGTRARIGGTVRHEWICVMKRSHIVGHQFPVRTAEFIDG